MRHESKSDKTDGRGGKVLAIGAPQPVSPELQSWIRNVIVPALLNEWIAENGGEKFLASLSVDKAESPARVTQIRSEVCR